MNTNNSVLAGRNTPVAISSEVVDIKTLVVAGSHVEIRVRDNGTKSFGNKALVASKATLKEAGKINGFLSALATLMDSPNGVFETGFHFSRGTEWLKDVLDGPKDRYGHDTPVAYVNFGLLQNDTRRAWLAGFGIKARKDSGTQWLALGARNGRLFPLWIVKPESKEKFLARVGCETMKEVGRAYRAGWERVWNTYNKHWGMELAMRVVAGKSKVITSLEEDFEGQGKKGDKIFEMLFATKEERQAHYAEAIASRDMYNDVARAKARLESEDEIPTVSEYVASVAEKQVVEVWSPTSMQAEEVDIASVVGKKASFVKADGSAARPGWMFCKDVDTVIAMSTLAENLGAYLYTK
jgi:hypothetical protein